MLADPQSVTINAVPISLPRTSTETNKGVYTSSDGTVIETVSHTYGRRTRRAVKLQHSKVAPDPLISSQNIKYSMSVTCVFDVPVTGYTVAEQKQVVDGLIAQLNASSGALFTKIRGGEN
jgi:urease gamma subunit